MLFALFTFPVTVVCDDGEDWGCQLNDAETIEGSSSSLSTGEDIGKITWPRVSAEPGHVAGEYEGVGPHSYLAEPAPPVPHGNYSLQIGGKPGSLDVEFGADGMVSLQYAAGDGVFASGGRVLRLRATVRQSWVTESARGATTRAEQGLRIARALAALASLPGQHTVVIEEQGMSAAENMNALIGKTAVA